MEEIEKNGFINFLKSFGKQNTEINELQFAIEGAKGWSLLNDAQKVQYGFIDEEDSGCNIPAPSCCKKKKKKPSCRRVPSCPKKKKKPSCRRVPSCPKKKKKVNRCAKKPRRCGKPKKKPCQKRKPACRPKPRCPPKRKPACRPKPRCGKRKKCSKPGPVMNNGYLNFLRTYRKKHCGLKPKELVMKGARAWCRLPNEKKDRYRRMACKVTKSPRHKRRLVCRRC